METTAFANNTKTTRQKRRRRRQLNMKSLDQRRDEADMVLVYKILSKKCNIDREKWFDIDNSDTGPITRANMNGIRIRPPFARTDRRKNFFTVRVCDNWNSLPATVKCAKNIGNFKRLYRLFTAGQPSAAMANERGDN
jgi:hypothetical protein